MTWHPPSAGRGSRGGWHWRTGLYSSVWARDTRWRGRKHSQRGKAAADMPRLLSDLTHASRGLCWVWEMFGWATGSSQDHNHIFGCPGRRSPRDLISQGTPLSPAAGTGGSSLPHSQSSHGPPHPSPPCPHSRLSSLHPGSQAVPRRPLLRAGEVLSQALYSYLCRAVINSQRLAAATRGGRFCPPATLQRQGLICLKHTPQPFHGDPFQFHGACTVLTGNEKERLIYGSAFQSLPSSLSTHAEGSGQFPSPKDPHWGQGLNRQGRGTAVRRGCWKEDPALPVPMSWSPPALSSPVSSSVDELGGGRCFVMGGGQSAVPGVKPSPPKALGAHSSGTMEAPGSYTQTSSTCPLPESRECEHPQHSALILAAATQKA